MHLCENDEHLKKKKKMVKLQKRKADDFDICCQDYHLE